MLKATPPVRHPDDVSDRWSRWKRAYTRAATLVVCALAAVNLWGFVEYRRDSAELARIAEQVAAGAATPSEQVERLTKYLANEIATDRPDSYFLLPIFRPLKPTAMQVLREGGDCSYKTRAFNVLAHHLGIDSAKWALYDAKGVPRHAVAVVETERGPLVADPLFGIVYEDTKGNPIRLEKLRDDPKQLSEGLAVATSNGNERAERYPIERYSYRSARSFNWEHLSATQMLYKGLARVFGSRWVDDLPIPYMVNEPYLLIVFVSGVGAAILLAPVVFWRARSYLRARRLRLAVLSAQPS